jgi:hypothetical protein
MVKFMITMFLLSVCLNLTAPESGGLFIAREEPIRPYEILWKAVCAVESSNNPKALNRLEMAYGISQIRYVRLHDYNKRTGSKYKLTDMYDPELSKQVFMYYCKGNDLERIAKSWNGSGRKTETYWKRIKKQL